MIPILYDYNEIDFKSNGLGLLLDCTSCYIEEERNETYELELTYPVGSFLYNEIKCNRYVKAKANNRYSPQIFRIYHISQPINGEITVNAEHISYKLNDNFIEKATCTGNCQTALNTLNSNAAFPTGFKFYSDISMSANFNIELVNLFDSIKGTEGSIIDTYGNGADIVRDNFNLSVVQNAGQDNNILIAYQKNMTGFTCEEDWTGCITRIYPYVEKDDNRITLPEKYIDSQYINRDPNPRIAKVDFSSYFENDEEVTIEKLREYATKYFLQTNCDIPSLNYQIEFILLSQTEEFKDKLKNESIDLFDSVIVKHELYNINTKIKVLKVKYDGLNEKYDKIELNYVKNTITSEINRTNKKIQDTKEELKDDIEDAKEEAADATNNLKVVMEKRDNEIELSVTNETEARVASYKVLDGKIEERVKEDDFEYFRSVTANEFSQKISRGNDFSSEMKQNVDAFKFLFKGASDGETTIDSNGITVKCGGFKVVNSSGKTVMEFNSEGQCIAKYMSATDLNCVNTGKNSAFYHMLYNMDETSFNKLNATKLYISGQHIYDYIVDVLEDKGLL